jgi:hypothetical protein
VHYTPLAHILPEFVPEQWTVTFPAAGAAEAQSADDAAAAAPAAAPAAAASLSPPQHGIDGSVLPRIWQHPSSLVVTRVNLTPLMLRVDNFLSAAECAEVLRMAYDPAAPAWKPYRNITYKPQTDSTGAVIAQKFEVGYSEAATLFQLDCQFDDAQQQQQQTHEHSAVPAGCSHARPSAAAAAGAPSAALIAHSRVWPIKCCSPVLRWSLRRHSSADSAVRRSRGSHRQQHARLRL